MSPPLDYQARLRVRVRRTEERCGFLERELAKAMRLLAALAQIVAADKCDPLALLSVVEELDERSQAVGAWTPSRTAALLRTTAPSVPSARAAA